MKTDATAELLTTLGRLEAVLADEDAALRGFDVAGIAQAAEAKAELEPLLQAAFAAVSRAPDAKRAGELAALRERVTIRGRANLVRLQASAHTVRDVLDRLTGRTRTTYGRERGSDATAVLASEVG